MRILLLIYLLTSFVFGTIRVCPNAEYGTVQDTITISAAGDTVVVPSGNVTWAKKVLNITRGIKLLGSGSGTTIIRGDSVLMYWLPNVSAQKAHDTLTISGFTFHGNNSNIGGFGIVRMKNTSSTNQIYLCVTNNIFRNIKSNGRGIATNGIVYGVICENIFDSVAIVMDQMGLDQISWMNQTQEYGTENNLYFEDNTVVFSGNMSGYSGWIEIGMGGRICVRYNTWDYSKVTNTDEIWDMHGLQGPDPAGGTAGCEQYSTMIAEFYGNRIINANRYRWMAQRGGWLLMFFNSYSGGSGLVTIGITQYYCDSCQAEGNFKQKANNTYLWKNLSNGAEDTARIYSPGAPPAGCDLDPIVQNVDYYNYEANFDGTKGVGCGTISKLPSTCTPGVAYWATDQNMDSIWVKSIGRNPQQKISGTFYKCIAKNAWKAYYIPYTYPHPLSPSRKKKPLNGFGVLNK